MNNPKVHTKSSMQVYKLYRVCRLHFEPNCFNGACKRALNTAIPTIQLNLNKNNSFKYNINKPQSIDMMEEESFSIIEEDNKINLFVNNLSENVNKFGSSNGSVEANYNEDEYENKIVDREAVEYILYEDDNGVNFVNDTQMAEEYVSETYSRSSGK